MRPNHKPFDTRIDSVLGLRTQLQWQRLFNYALLKNLVLSSHILGQCWPRFCAMLITEIIVCTIAPLHEGHCLHRIPKLMQQMRFGKITSKQMYSFVQVRHGKNCNCFKGYPQETGKLGPPSLENKSYWFTLSTDTTPNTPRICASSICETVGLQTSKFIKRAG